MNTHNTSNTCGTVDDAISLLNEKGPKDWFNKIDLSRFSVENGNTCVLYYVFGSFKKGLVELGMYDLKSPRVIGNPLVLADINAFWHPSVNSEWKTKIKQMQEEYKNNS